MTGRSPLPSKRRAGETPPVMRIGTLAGAGALVAAAAAVTIGPRLWRRMLDWGSTAEEAVASASR